MTHISNGLRCDADAICLYPEAATSYVICQIRALTSHVYTAICRYKAVLIVRFLRSNKPLMDNLAFHNWTWLRKMTNILITIHCNRNRGVLKTVIWKLPENSSSEDVSYLKTYTIRLEMMSFLGFFSLFRTPGNRDNLKPISPLPRYMCTSLS